MNFEFVYLCQECFIRIIFNVVGRKKLPLIVIDRSAFEKLKMKSSLLIIDSATCNISDGELVCGDIKAVFPPANVTPVLQPMDQNVL